MPDDDSKYISEDAPYKPKRGKSTYDSNQPTNTDWSLDRMRELQDWYGTAYPGKKLPVVNMGQGGVHNKLGFDHRESADIGLNPTTPEGAAFGAKLKELNVPFLAFDRAVPGASTGAHYHIGRPSHNSGGRKFPVGSQVKRMAQQRPPAEDAAYITDDPDVAYVSEDTAPKKKPAQPPITSALDKLTADVNARMAGIKPEPTPRAKTPRVEDIFARAVDENRPVPQRKLSGLGELRENDDPKAARIIRIGQEVAASQAERARVNRELGVRTAPFDANAEILRRVAEEELKESPADEIAKENERLRSERVARMPLTQKLANIPEAVGQGVTGFAESALTTAAVLSKSGYNIARAVVPDAIPLADPGEVPDSPLYQAGQWIKTQVESRAAYNPDLAEDFAYGKAPNTLGQLAPFAFGGWITGGSKLATAVLGGVATGGDVYEEVRSAGGTDDDAVLTALVGAAVLGPTELIGMRGLMKAVAGTAAEGSLRAALKATLRAGTRDAFENWAQETGQEYLQGLLTGQGRSGAQLLEAGALGALMGPVTGVATLASSIPDNITLHPAYERWLKTPEEKLAALDQQMAALESEAGLAPLDPESASPVSQDGERRPVNAQSAYLDQQRTAHVEPEGGKFTAVIPTASGEIRTTVKSEAAAQEIVDRELAKQDAVTEEDSVANAKNITPPPLTQPVETPAQVAPTINATEIEDRVAARLREQHEVPYAEYTDEGMRRILGSQAGNLNQLVDIGVITKTPEGRYQFNDRIIEQATEKTVGSVVPPSGETDVADDSRYISDDSPQRKYYEERLADPELVRYAVTANSPEGDLFAVPVGGSRKTGASDVIYTRAEGERLLQKIVGLPGFDDARLRPVGEKFSLEWGGPAAGYRSETNPTEKIGRAYGYSEKAIADFTAEKHGRSSLSRMLRRTPDQVVEDLRKDLADDVPLTDSEQIELDKMAVPEVGDRLTHTNAAINNKPIVAKTDDGRVVVPNEANKSGVSVVKPRDFAAEAELLKQYKGKLTADYNALQNHRARREGLSITNDDTASNYFARLRRFAETHNPEKAPDLVDRAEAAYNRGRFGEATGLAEQALSGTHDFGNKVTGARLQSQNAAKGRPIPAELGSSVSQTVNEARRRLEEPGFITKARERVEAERRRIADGGRVMRSGGPDTRALIDQLLVRGYDFYTGTVKPTFEQWAAKLRAEFGTSAEPHLKNIWAKVSAADKSYQSMLDVYGDADLPITDVEDLGDIDTQAQLPESARTQADIATGARQFAKGRVQDFKEGQETDVGHTNREAREAAGYKVFQGSASGKFYVQTPKGVHPVVHDDIVKAHEAARELYAQEAATDLGDIDMRNPERGAVDLNAIREGLKRKPRSLPKTLEKSGRDPGTNLTYDPLPNEPEFNKVIERLRTEGAEALEEWYRSAPESAERTFAHEVLVDHYQAQAVAEDNAELKARATELSNLEAERATIGGQATQAYAHLNKYTPAGLSLQVAKAKQRMKAVGKELSIPAAELKKAEDAAREHKAADTEVKKKRAVVQKLEVEAGITEPVAVGAGVGKGPGAGGGSGRSGKGGASKGTTVSTTLKPKVPRAPKRNYLGDFLAEFSPNERVLEGAQRMIGDTDLARWMRETKARYKLSQEDATRLGQQSHALLKKARKAATAERRLDTLRRKYPDATTDELLVARDELDAAIRRRRDAKQELARFFDKLSQKQQGYWRRSMNITRAMMVSQLSTAMRNLQSQAVRYNVERLTDLTEHALRRTVGMESDFTTRSIARNTLRQLTASESKAREIAGEHPAELARMFNEYFAGIEIPELEHGPISNKFHAAVERMFVKAERASKLVNFANQMQEFHLRAAEFLSELDLHLRKDHNMSLEKFVARFGTDAIPKATVEKAVQKSLEVTFADNPGRDGAGGQLLNALINVGNYIPPTVSPVAFPKFMFNSLKFLYQYNPTGLIDLARKGQNRPRVIARALVGSAMLLTALGFRDSDYAGEKWYELRVGGHTLDTRPFGPFSTYLFFAEAIRRAYKGEKHFTPKEIAEAIGASSGPGGTAIAVADKLYNYAAEGQWDKWQRVLKTEGGDFGRALLTPIRQLKDLIAAFDPEEGYTRDTSGAPFTGPIRESIPFASRSLPIAGRPTTATPIHQEHPAIKALTGWRVETPKTFLERQLDELHFTFAEIRPSTGIAPIDAFEKRAMGPLMDQLSNELENDPEFTKLGPAQRADLLKDHIENIREEVRDMGKAELPEEYEQLKEDRKPRRKRELEEELNSPGLSRAIQLGVPMGIPAMRSDEDDLAYRARLLQLGKARRTALDTVAGRSGFNSLTKTAQRNELHAALA